MTKLHSERFADLEQQIQNLFENAKAEINPTTGKSYFHIETESRLNWTVKAQSLLSNACGTGSTHLEAFVETDKAAVLSNNFERLKRLRAVFLAAKEDYDGGYLNSVKNLIHAEVFSTELDQASELLASGYKLAAAVIAGVVLETTVRNLCDARNIPHDKLDRMNADLVKAGAYNTLQQKRITALAAIRNSAAHGKPGDFTEDEVTGMIADVERFLSAMLQ